MTLARPTGQTWLQLVFLGSCAALPSAAVEAASGAHCTLSSTALAFGQYVPSRGAPSDFTATINVTCAASGIAPVAILGTVTLLASGGASDRELTDGLHRMRYQLFLDPARTVVWGDGNGNGGTQSIAGVVGPTMPFRATFTVYGRILARQFDVVVGNYTAHIAALLNY
ncbi:MAG TPA: spore coat U domain-containing protein [Sphingomonas sp.]|nr:spore coat U domain-containing protein [Sphingomonas sp.]